MTASTISAGNVVTRFQRAAHREYVRGGKFGPFIGRDTNSIIVTNRNLKKYSIPLVAKLSGVGREKSEALQGFEEELANYDDTYAPFYQRNAVLIDNEEREKSEFDLYMEARPALSNWVMERKRDEIIQALGATPQSGSNYFNYGGSKGKNGSAPADNAAHDAWLTASADRIMYGADLGNTVPGDHSASLLAMAAGTDEMSADVVSKARRVAERADPLIRPYMMNGDTPWFVMFVGMWGFRDLKADPVIAQANREARPRDVKENPIFNAGDLIYDGVIIKEIVEIDSLFIDGAGSGPFDGVWGANATANGLHTAGAAGARCSMATLCGAQAAAMVIGRNQQYHLRKEDDYAHLNGVGVACKHDIGKTMYNGKQHGVVTVFHTASGDS